MWLVCLVIGLFLTFLASCIVFIRAMRRSNKAAERLQTWTTSSSWESTVSAQEIIDNIQKVADQIDRRKRRPGLKYIIINPDGMSEVEFLKSNGLDVKEVEDVGCYPLRLNGVPVYTSDLLEPGKFLPVYDIFEIHDLIAPIQKKPIVSILDNPKGMLKLWMS